MKQHWYILWRVERQRSLVSCTEGDKAATQGYLYKGAIVKKDRIASEFSKVFIRKAKWG